MGAVLIISLLILMFIGMPIAYALVLCSGVTLVSTDFADLIIIVQRLFNGLDSFLPVRCSSWQDTLWKAAVCLRGWLTGRPAYAEEPEEESVLLQWLPVQYLLL